MKRATTVLLLLAALGTEAAPAAPPWHDRGAMTLARAAGKSLDQAVAQVRRETGGRILSARTVQRDGRKMHRIKVLTRDRKVRIIYVDAK